MATLTDADHWFATCDDYSLCRVGGNGPVNVTQIFPLVKYVQDGESFLDVGCGSGTTLDALTEIKKQVEYKGIDFIEHRVEWLKEHYKNHPLKPKFAVGDARAPKEKDKSYDVVWSRHVVDHLNDFEGPMDEHCRIAKKRVICVLFVSFSDRDEHDIKPIIDGPQEDRKTYEDEWQNQYSKKKVNLWLEQKQKEGWQILEFQEDCVWDLSRNNKGHDTVIILERTNG